MVRRSLRHRQRVVVIGVLAALAAPARADDNDLVLSRLGTTVDDSVIGSNSDFRSLASELGVVLAPRLLEPADTLGFGGFQFAADMAFTSISNGARYWRALESSRGPGMVHGDGTMKTFGVFVRKGIWLPLPSFEIGLGAVNLHQSRMWAGQGYVKFALHEGYHDLPLPSLAVRGSGSRLMGSPELDLTVASIDVTASKDFGIAGTLRASPYIGWNWLIMVPRSEVIDKTPHIDVLDDRSDEAMNFVFVDQDNILRNRFFAGAKLKFHVFTLHLEAAFALAGSSVDDRSGTNVACADTPDPTADCDAKDRSGAQSTLSAGLGLDF